MIESKAMAACYPNTRSQGVAGLTLVILLFLVWPLLPDASDLPVQPDATKLMRDDATGLIWATCVEGQSGSQCQGEALSLAWADALNRARGAEHGGITNWRMPRIEEIKTMHRRVRARLANLFPRLDQSIVWSASANIDYATDAWAFDFIRGKSVVRARDEKLHLLLVSGP